jgi:hypothetical protein
MGILMKDMRGMLADAERHGEPVFILRAKDILAPRVIENYLDMVILHSTDNIEFTDQIHDVIDAMKQWQKANPLRVKFPD